jgi:hypothetical protein
MSCLFLEAREGDNHVYKGLLCFDTKDLILKTERYLELVARSDQHQALPNREALLF